MANIDFQIFENKLKPILAIFDKNLVFTFRHFQQLIELHLKLVDYEEQYYDYGHTLNYI